ncbi:MAG: ABC transporter substrate-binding protein [Aigarchaeota archaeon]|nr:ABC transporter substrate-binding protein [Candidatus Pelearchaeum maunauluense]
MAIGGLIGYILGGIKERTETATQVTEVTKTVVGESPRPSPTLPVKIGSQAFFSGPVAVASKPQSNGLRLAVKEINEQGGLLGREVELVEREEGRPDATLREFKRLVIEEKIDYFIGLISSANTPAVGPEAEELGVITIFVDGCTDKLWEEAVPNPHYVFRTNNTEHVGQVAAAAAATVNLYIDSGLVPKNPRIIGIHPDYAYGRNSHIIFSKAISKMVPDAEILEPIFTEFLKTSDFTPHITSILQKEPDIVVTSLWGSDYINFYKQGLPQGLFNKTRIVATASYIIPPHLIGLDHPAGHIMGVDGNYYFEYPPFNIWPLNQRFVEAYYKMWGEYPTYMAEGARNGAYWLKNRPGESWKNC